MSVYRPVGVTVIAIVYIILGVLGILSGILAQLIYIPIYQNMMIELAITDYFYIFYNLPMFPPELASLLLSTIYTSMIITMISTQSSINMMSWVFAISLISTAAMFITAFGLLSMKKWGYYLAVILGILMIFSIIGLVIAIYLLVSDVKYDFEQ